jgi:type IV secretion system protein TrbL
MGPAGKSETQAAAMLPPSRGPDAPGGGSTSEPSPRSGGTPGGGTAAAVESSAAQFSGARPVGSSATSGSAASTSSEPAWAKRIKRSQSVAHGVSLAAHSIRAGDAHGAGTSINLSEGR